MSAVLAVVVVVVACVRFFRAQSALIARMQAELEDV